MTELTELRDEAYKQAEATRRELALVVSEETMREHGCSFGRIQEALALAKECAVRAMTLSEAAAVEQGLAPRFDDPAAPAPGRVTPAARAGLRLVAGGADEVPPAPASAPQASVPGPDWGDRNTAIKEIRRALKERSGKDWSVRGDRGTAWGWITICAPPRRMFNGYMTEEDQVELGALLGLDRPAHRQGVDVRPDNRVQFVKRARKEWSGPPRY